MHGSSESATWLPAHCWTHNTHTEVPVGEFKPKSTKVLLPLIVLKILLANALLMCLYTKQDSHCIKSSVSVKAKNPKHH